MPNFFLLSSHQREIFCTIFTSPQKVKGIIGKSLVWPISRFMLSWGKHDFPFIRTKSSSSQKFTQIEYSFYRNKAIIWQQSWKKSHISKYLNQKQFFLVRFWHFSHSYSTVNPWFVFVNWQTDKKLCLFWTNNKLT